MLTDTAILSLEDAHRLLRLQVIVARAGQRDSLQWWDDESMSPQGQYIMERVFPGAPHNTTGFLSMLTAENRHRAAFEPVGRVTHLYHISPTNIDKLTTFGINDLNLDGLDAPVTSIAALRALLEPEIKGEPSYKVTNRSTSYSDMRIELKRPTDDLIVKASTLAWAYLEGEPGRPVFPYLAE